jgi:catechol 2,3-dioxygenase-like lactoylglutathione lyase family enzyme
MANPFCHVELASTDVAKAKTFYSTLFDWKTADTDMGGGMIYSTFRPTDDSPGGGMMQHPVPGAPSAWLPYVLVDEVHAATKKPPASERRSCAKSPRSPTWAGSASSSTPPAPPWASGSKEIELWQTKKRTELSFRPKLLTVSS